MKQAERKAHKRALKKRQKERRKEKRQQETAQPATEERTETTMETTQPAQNEIFTRDEVRGALRGALETVTKVMRMVNQAIDTVIADDADKVFAARVTAQRLRDYRMGIRTDEKTLIRVHPLFALWKLAHQCARQIEALLRLTNPKEFAQWKLTADKAAKAAAKLEAKAEKAAA